MAQPTRPPRRGRGGQVIRMPAPVDNPAPAPMPCAEAGQLEVLCLDCARRQLQARMAPPEPRMFTTGLALGYLAGLALGWALWEWLPRLEAAAEEERGA